MSVGTPGKLIASSFGLAGFAVAIVAGLSAGNSSPRILTVALVSMMACHLVGLGAGMVGENTIESYMDRYRGSRPLGSPAGDAAPKAGAQSETS